MSSSKSPILIVGAGPTGLLCSIWLTRYGVPHRIIDKLAAPGLASRAMGVHARTLELYRSLGIASPILKLGHPFRDYSFFYHGEHLFSVPIGHAGVGLSPYPIVLSVTQDEHEEALEKHLASLGTVVERNVELLSLKKPSPDEPLEDIKVVLRDRNGKEEQLRASYIVGADGARSAVRSATGIQMEGGTYPRSFYVADVLCSGNMPTAERMNLFVTRDEYACFLPLPHREGRARIIGLVPKQFNGRKDVTFDDLRPLIKTAAPALDVGEVQWFATYNAHHRCAAHFHFAHRIFLCGDAAHLHSPVGAQGMNTGLGDASNLAWKLATAWHNTGNSDLDVEALLASYETERQPFAQELVNTTDTFFKYFTNEGWRGHLVRNFIIYYVLPFVTRMVNAGRHMYKLESQIAISYPTSVVSQSIGMKSNLPGSRLPWVSEVRTEAKKLSESSDESSETDNHAVLDAKGWQAHTFSASSLDGSLSDDQQVWFETVQAATERHNVTFHTFVWDEAARKAGFEANMIYLVRPDGYIGMTISPDTTNVEKVMDEYLARFGAQWLLV